MWLDDKDYPDQHDIDKFGDDSPYDDDPLTIGYIGEPRPSFWNAKRIGLAVIILLMVGALVVPSLLRLL